MKNVAKAAPAALLGVVLFGISASSRMASARSTPIHQFINSSANDIELNGSVALYARLPEFEQLSSTAVTDSDSWPVEVVEILKRHTMWQSTSSLSAPGFGGMLGYSRKWRIDLSGTPTLREVTALSIKKDCGSGKNLSWIAGAVDLSARLDTTYFHIGFFDPCAQSPQGSGYTFRVLSGDRIEIRPIQMGISVVLFPEIKTTKIETLDPTSANDFNIYLAPGGPNGGRITEAALGLPFEKTAYLHHDLRQSIDVVIDESFPPEYIPVLQASLSAWNSGVGAQLLKLNPVPAKVDLADCLSSRKLCIFWDGPHAVPWLGMGGYTAPNFDPETGEIIGGYIQFSNTGETNLAPTPPSALVDRYVAGDIPPDLVATLYSKRSEFIHYLHPKPEWELANLFSHELGHFNGLSHNFMGSNAAVLPETTTTLMDYSAFSSRTSEPGALGEYDHEMLRLMYSGVKPKEPYIYCGDDMVGHEGPSPDPNCNQWDFGASDEWFIALAKLGSDGVFTPHPKFQKPILDFLGEFLKSSRSSVSNEQRSNVREYLCSQTVALQKIKDYLAQQRQIEFVCP